MPGLGSARRVLFVLALVCEAAPRTAGCPGCQGLRPQGCSSHWRAARGWPIRHVGTGALAVDSRTGNDPSPWLNSPGAGCGASWRRNRPALHSDGRSTVSGGRGGARWLAFAARRAAGRTASVWLRGCLSIASRWRWGRASIPQRHGFCASCRPATPSCGYPAALNGPSARSHVCAGVTCGCPPYGRPGCEW